MIKALIADDNLNFTKFFINSVISEIKNLQIIKITTDGNETIKFISQNQIDLVFLDLQMPNLNGIEILNEIKKIDFVKVPKFIIVSGDVKFINEIRLHSSVQNIIQKTEDTNMMINKIKQIINDLIYIEKYPEIKETVILELSNMGYNIKHQGTRYLIEAIMFAYEKNDFTLTNNLRKNIYKYIAQRNNKSILNIETNITKASKNIKSDEYLPKFAISNILSKISYLM